MDNRDPYGTATGRLMLAFMPEWRLAAFLAKRGLPQGIAWPQIQNHKQLLAALQEIRAQAFSERHTDSVTAIAYAIWEQEDVTASLGCYLPTFRFKGAHRKQILERFKKAAQAISQDLATRN
jgi:DNA-binding IclR family transcriptional regulator